MGRSVIHDDLKEKSELDSEHSTRIEFFNGEMAEGWIMFIISWCMIKWYRWSFNVLCIHFCSSAAVIFEGLIPHQYLQSSRVPSL